MSTENNTEAGALPPGAPAYRPSMDITGALPPGAPAYRPSMDITGSQTQQVIGFVQSATGNVTAMGDSGSVRLLHLGDPVYADDTIRTGAAGRLVILFLDGRHSELDHNADVSFGSDFSAFTEQAGTGETLDAIQQAILAGADPTTILEAPAVGRPSSPSGPILGDNGTQAVTIERVGEHTTPDSGFETTGLSFETGRTVQREAQEESGGLTLNTPQAPPVAVNDSASTPEDTAVVIAVLDNDSDADGTLTPATVTIISSPAHGTVSVNPANGEVTYTPDPNYNGPDSFSYRVDDDEGNRSNEATVNLTVIAPQGPPVAPQVPPVAVSDSAGTPEETAVVIDVLNNDSDADGTLVPSTVTIVSSPAHGTVSVNPANGEVTYTPEPNYQGPDSFSYRVNDDEGNSSNAATVNLTVVAPQAPPPPPQEPPVAPQEPPVAVNDSAGTPEETAVVIDVLDNDSDADGTLDPARVTIVSGPAHGTVSVDPVTGEVTYTPAPNYNGPDSFSYRVDDDEGNSSNAATVNLTVAPTDDIPVANPDSDLVGIGGTTTGNVITGAGNATADDQGDAPAKVTKVIFNGTVFDISGTAIISGNHGDLTIDENGDYTYHSTASSPDGAKDTFEYVIEDSDQDSSQTTLTISQSDNSPQAADDSNVVKESGLATGSEPDMAATTATGNLLSNDVNLSGVTISNIDGVTPDGNGVIRVTPAEGHQAH